MIVTRSSGNAAETAKNSTSAAAFCRSAKIAGATAETDPGASSGTPIGSPAPLRSCRSLFLSYLRYKSCTTFATSSGARSLLLSGTVLASWATVSQS